MLMWCDRACLTNHLEEDMNGFLLIFWNTCSRSAERQSNTDEQTLAKANRPISEDLPKCLNDFLAGKQGLWVFNPPQISLEVLFSQMLHFQPGHLITVFNGNCIMFWKPNWFSLLSKWSYHRFSNTHFVKGGIESSNIEGSSVNRLFSGVVT